jgi:CO/xanthine dehydrogenase FAD-binding subunit
VSFVIAGSLDEALSALAAGARPIAGGTDLVVGARQGKAPLPESLVAIDRLDELSQIETTESGTRIGAMVTHARLMTDPTVVSGYTALADAAALVGSPSTRNMGTLGGNVMNASPAMDAGAPLVVLGAMAQLQSIRESRTVALSDLWTGPGETNASADELCVAIDLPSRPDRSGSAYVRLEYRRAMEIAVVGAAASVTLTADGTVAAASVALTAVAPTIITLNHAETLMVGQSPDAAASVIATAASKQSVPISDLRASDLYRRHMVGVMAARAVEAAAQRASGNEIGVPVNRAIGVGASR